MQDATKVDLKRELGRLYKATASPEVIDVPTMAFLAVDGIGDPNTSPAYADAIAALYAVSYGLKFAIKRGPASLDYTVMPLEGLWWADDMNSFMKGRRDLWHWTAMIAQPEVVDADLVAQVVGETKKKKPGVALDQLRFEMFTEGRAAQLLHTGPYAAEAPSIERLHAFVLAQGGKLSGKHHEIYLGDPRRVAPEKLRTIIRQPFVPAK